MPAYSLEHYATDAHRYDELRDGSGAVRPHWRPLVERLYNEIAKILAMPDVRQKLEEQGAEIVG